MAWQVRYDFTHPKYTQFLFEQECNKQETINQLGVYVSTQIALTLHSKLKQHPHISIRGCVEETPGSPLLTSFNLIPSMDK